jgi:chemotaxis protein MotA
MKKPNMDLLSVIGVVLALVAIVGGNLLDGGHANQLFQLTALLIVGGGTLGAAMIQTSLPVFLRAMQMARWVFIMPQINLESTLEKVVNWSHMSRREGLLALENASELESDLFSRKGLQLLVDGNEPAVIRNVLETEIIVMERFELQAAKVYEIMGGYSPTIGILGAVMGLIHVMNNLADPGKLGAGIATAFVATIYGVGFANLLLLPMAGKLKSMVQQRVLQYEMLMEGIVSIADGDNPRNIESRLQSYLR